MTQSTETETAAGFLASRIGWLRVETMDLPDGRWDVVLRIDGTYSADVAGDKERMVDYFAEWLMAVIEAEGIDWRRR